MELLTRSQEPGWDRVVYLYVHKCAGVSECINDKDTYKILVLDSGSITIEYAGSKRVVSAPSVVLLTDDEISISEGRGVETTTVYLKPTEIREEFTAERIKSGEFENEIGKTIFQDYTLIKSFQKVDNNIIMLPLSVSAYSRITKIIESLAYELREQDDGFWPCRSRSFMMELLYFVCYVCAESGLQSVSDTVKDDLVNRIILYLSENIGVKLSLEDIIKEFSINRNKLNELFIQETSMTCMNYFTKMRINLAQIMLAETELLITEIAERVGYEEANYFAKVFKKYTGVTPSKYRDSFMQ